MVTFTGADQVVDGSTAAASAATGAPSVSLTTTRAGSWVWGVGNDWDRATARTVGPSQTKVDEFLASVGDTLWVQRQTSATPFAATPVTLNDTAPTTDRWNLAAVEVLPAVTDTQAPTAPTNLAAGTVTATQVPLSWSASSDDQGVAGYRIFRGAGQVGEVAGTSFTDTTVAPRRPPTPTRSRPTTGPATVSPASEPGERDDARRATRRHRPSRSPRPQTARRCRATVDPHRHGHGRERHRRRPVPARRQPGRGRRHLVAL